MQVISGLDTAVRTMQEGGLRRIVIPPSQGYQNTTQGPIPPNVIFSSFYTSSKFKEEAVSICCGCSPSYHSRDVQLQAYGICFLLLTVAGVS